MIITKTPFRMSFFGGGTDLQEYFREHEGAVLSTTFDKYCYVEVRHLPPFFSYANELIYSRTERVREVDEIQHPLIRNGMKMLDMHELKVTYDADLPARSGLGTSSSFAVGMLNAFYALKAYFDWCDRSPQPGLTDCNRFSWEQTGGCWLNTAEKGFDLYDGAVSLHPMNSRYLLTLLNDFPEGDREIKLNQRKIIRYACPALAEIPYDNGKKEGDNAVTAVREQWRKAVRRLRTMGLRKTVAAYARILRDVKKSGGNYR